MKNVQPILFMASDHVRRHARARKNPGTGDPRALECRLYESFPLPRVAEFGVITTLSGHGMQVERAALVQKLAFLHRSHLENLHRAPHTRSVLDMQRPDIVGAAAQQIETALQA